MRTIIGGSRSICDAAALEAAIGAAGFDISGVVTSDSSGIDALVARWARQRGLPVEVVSTDWKRNGGRADLIRNEYMAREAEACILVWDGFSRGTRHMIEVARSRGLKLHIQRWPPPEDEAKRSSERLPIIKVSGGSWPRKT